MTWNDLQVTRFGSLSKSEKRQREIDSMFVDHYRLLCDDRVIATYPATLGEQYAMRLLGMFKQHILNALLDPKDFVFDGVMNASQYIDFHQQRFGMELSTNLQIVGPNKTEIYRLAPNSHNIV